MTADSDPLAHPGAPERFPLSRRELAIIAAVWSAYAVLSIASRLFDLPERGSTFMIGSAGVALAEALCWALLTPPILALADRFDPDRDRARQIVQFLVLGVVVAVAVGWLGTWLRQTLTPGGPRPPRDVASFDAMRGLTRGRGGRGRGGPPIWFGILNAIVLYLGVVAAGIARAFSRRYALRRHEAARREAELHAQLAEARLDALRRQLDPHFLFNTLNAVSALVERDPRGVRRMIARLSELLRHSFEGGDEAEAPLREELALLARYVEIMQVRFQGRLTVETHADENVLDALVPTMILQPIVENAIKHGVERATGPGSVRIGAAADGGALVLTVRDDGPGPAAPSARTGVGVRNTVERLRQLYGDAGSFTLAPGATGGTVAEIRLPLRTRARALGTVTALGGVHV
ncbi:histidine kinase internal region [Gemmatirosa kalamazoonensis]|uniref:Histidine kinase internal region n=1 Tax=Gemmatirosa kalamazoonensis TaxID=861299 RepID=W0RIY8_9BACT|nr:histidine kinase [Gemmatirosa kalamazoonensis]AHG89373.1 histidine kinase internal region [Gemmatirosa kalamazoonensis]